MGDAGGRDLIFSLHSLDGDSEQSLRLAEVIPEVFLHLSAFQTPSNFDASFCDPIKSAKVTSLSGRDTFNGSKPSGNRYSGNSKPVYVRADILSSHLDTGESTGTTSEFRKIALIIRGRGIGGEDDCGHIIGKQNGGKMIDYNLFPQDKRINRGLGVWRYIWKWGVELFIRIWLISQAEYDPMVRVRIRLFYPTNPTSDRPTTLHYHFQFYKRSRKNKKGDAGETDANSIALRLFIRAAIYGEVPNECFQVDEAATKASVKSLKASLKELERMARVPELKKLIELYTSELDEFLSPPTQVSSGSSSAPPMSSNKPFSWWDVVPVIGSVRTLDDAVECAKADDGIGTAINGVLGVGGLVLDVLSLGTIGLFGKAANTAIKAGAREGGKMAIKTGMREGGKMAVKLTAQQVFKIAVEQMVKEGIEALVQTLVTQTARRAIERIARQS